MDWGGVGLWLSWRQEGLWAGVGVCVGRSWGLLWAEQDRCQAFDPVTMSGLLSPLLPSFEG